MSWWPRGRIAEETEPRYLRRWAALLRHEMVQLAVLIGIAAAAFLVTRVVAAGSHDIASRDAGEWYRRGQEALAAGRIDDATDYLRRAVARRRGDRTYSLALARALALRGDTAAARQQLLALRESAPEDPVINLELARLAGARGDAAEAQRFYYNALYAPWAPERVDQRRRVRMELIRLLAAHGESARALSELVAVSAEVPDTAADQSEVAQLFADAGDQRRALTHFQQALAHPPQDAAALGGAGLAAFRLGDYTLARKYLHASRDTSQPVAESREIVDLVLDRDPLAPRLGSVERRRRADAVVARARERLALCTTPQPDALAEGPATLVASLDAFQRRLGGHRAIDQDTVEDALQITSRIEKYVGERCAPPAPIDRALQLIAVRHGSAAP